MATGNVVARMGKNQRLFDILPRRFFAIFTNRRGQWRTAAGVTATDTNSCCFRRTLWPGCETGRSWRLCLIFDEKLDGIHKRDLTRSEAALHWVSTSDALLSQSGYGEVGAIGNPRYVKGDRKFQIPFLLLNRIDPVCRVWFIGLCPLYLSAILRLE